MAIIEENLDIAAEFGVSKESKEFQTERVVTLAVAHGAHDTYFSFLPPLLPLLIQKLSLTNAEAGLLTVFWQGPALLQPFIGHLADRVNLRPCLPL